MHEILLPLEDRVFVQPIEEASTYGSGLLHKPDTAKERPQMGIVFEVGQGVPVGRQYRAMTVAVGDKVLYGKYSGVEVEVDGISGLVMRESEILAIVREESDDADATGSTS